jgi:putative tryptophan/tyrosine transport system substrate-binding protein
VKRREFVRLIGGAAASWPIGARAQRGSVPVIGLISGASPDRSIPILRAFREGLFEIGFAENSNVTIEYRWALGQNDQLPELAADLVRRRVDVIATLGSTPAALAAKAVTTEVPIVFQVGSDPVAAGLTLSLSRPGSNVTGITNLNTELGPKRLELLRDLVPGAKVMALLVNPTSRFITETMSRDMQLVARDMGIDLQIVPASAEGEFEGAFATLVQQHISALVIAPDSLFISNGEQLGAMSLRQGVPAITQFREFAVGGGLMAYGGSVTATARQAGVYVGRILKGERPGELPVVQTANVELVINLKTAKALGLTVPPALLARADEVIE